MEMRKKMSEKSYTIQQQKALLDFWFHMCNRIARDANIQYYCGTMTETLRLAVDAYHELHPEISREELEARLISSGVSNDSDVIRLKERIKELEEE
jgi:hypothetical protein